MMNHKVPAKTTIKVHFRGKPKDSTQKRFMKRNDIFADVFNGYFCKGKKVVKPNELIPVDTVSTIAYRGPDGELEYVERIRDVLKRAVIYSDGHRTYLLLGIENQSTVDPSMVFRCMCYDAFTYLDQMDALQKLDRKATNVQRPDLVVTLVIYFGHDRWNAPKSVYEAVGLTDAHTNPFATSKRNYGIDVLEPRQMTDEDISAYDSSIQEVLFVLKYYQDRKTLSDMVAKNERFGSMDPEAVELIKACTGAKFTYDKRKRKVDMRSAFEEERLEGFAEGKAEGMKKGIEKGIEKGIKKGRAEGVKQGRAEGMEKGRAEGQNGTVNLFV